MENKMRGKLPTTELLILEAGKEQWQALAGKQIDYQVTAVVERFPGIRVRIKLLIKQIYSPQHVRNKARYNSESVFNQIVPSGQARMMEFFHSNIINKNLWVFVGLIDGESKVPIMIHYYENLNIFVYTQKLEGENEKDWLQIASQN